MRGKPSTEDETMSSMFLRRLKRWEEGGGRREKVKMRVRMAQAAFLLTALCKKDIDMAMALAEDQFIFTQYDLLVCAILDFYYDSGPSLVSLSESSSCISSCQNI